MDIRKVAIIACLIFQVEGRPGVDVFLNSFVENERKPTMVIFHGICWKNSVKVHVMKELSIAGIRSSNAMSERTSYQDQAVLFVTDLDCPEAAEAVKNAIHRSLHRQPYRWLVLTSVPAHNSSLWDPFLTDSELVIATAEGAGYRMTEIHKPGFNMSTILTPRGVFNGVLTDVRPHRELFRRRSDVMGAPMIMASGIMDSESSKYHMLQEDMLELQYDIMSKNCYTLAKIGFLMLNATPRATFHYTYGYLLENGTWTGMIKDLIDYKADLGTNVGVTTDRLGVVTYIDSMDNSRVRFIFRQPALSITANIFSLPFSSGVWIATAISSFIAAVAYYLSARATTRERDWIAADAFLLSMGAISQQGCEVQPKNLSARIVLWVIFTAFMALYAAYSANIVVLLQAPSSSVKTFTQLSRSKLALGAYDVDYNHFLFRKGDPDPIRNHILNTINPDKGPKRFYNFTEGVEKIRKGLFAFHSLVEPVYRQIEKTYQETEKCDLVEIDFMGFTGLHAPASKLSPYLELLRVTFRRLREVGIKSAVNFRYEARKPSCRESVAMFSSVGILELRPVLLFMSYGVALSVIVAVAEQLVFRVNRYRLRPCRLAERLLVRRIN